ncbi:MAG: monovalent cation/H(+) antiporter subunit G [Microbacteriaceae bacterium]
MSVSNFLDSLTAVLVLLSAFMSLSAGIGLVRFPDLMSRQHAGAKPQTLGIIAMVLAVAIQNPNLGVLTLLVLIMAFQLFTQPVSSHMISRSGYRTKHLKSELLVVDELKSDIERADREQRESGPANQ